METPDRQLTESRIRELLAGMPKFHEKIRDLGRTETGQAPVTLPPASEYPPASSLADVAAPYYSDDPAEVAFYQDVMRLQELWTYVNMPGSARARIDAAIAGLRLQSMQSIDNVPDAEMAALFGEMITSRIEQLESVTDEELDAITRLGPEVEKELFHRAQSTNGGRPSRSRSRKQNEE